MNTNPTTDCDLDDEPWEYCGACGLGHAPSDGHDCELDDTTNDGPWDYCDVCGDGYDPSGPHDCEFDDDYAHLPSLEDAYAHAVATRNYYRACYDSLAVKAAQGDPKAREAAVKARERAKAHETIVDLARRNLIAAGGLPVRGVAGSIG